MNILWMLLGIWLTVPVRVDQAHDGAADGEETALEPVDGDMPAVV
jgi:hypothetical protein